ncbi:Toll/interleukin-1 receptor domain-containing adapter protein [Plecturocebus cupreus]
MSLWSYRRSPSKELPASCPSPDPKYPPGQVEQRAVPQLVMLSSYPDGGSMKSRLGFLPPPPLPMPAPGSRPKKPLGKMADWFRQTLLKKPKKMPDSPESAPSDASQPTSQDSPLPPSHSSVTSPSLPPSQTSDSSSIRWSKDYDVCVCHSEEDLVAAQDLVSYLESSTANLRCFLQLRDATPGGAIVSELCQALSSSHCRVLLITPGFLQDPWCKYQMLQALTDAPGAEGRTIPLLSGLSRAAYPPELRFMYYVDGRGPDGGFHQVKEAVMRYLQTLS